MINLKVTLLSYCQNISADLEKGLAHNTAYYLKKRKQRIRRNNETVSNSKYEKLLGVKVDHELNFNEHVSSLCKKASQKVNALSRIASYMTFDQRRLILNSFITSHFSYCPIVWMFHSRKLNERIISMKGTKE